MAKILHVEGSLTDGMPMRVFLAERDGIVCRASMHDDVYPLSEDEFIWRAGRGSWKPIDRQAASLVLKEAASQIAEYFAGRRLQFEIPWQLEGTPFQVRVWRELINIRYGQRRSYGQIAESIGHPSAFRAVGNANGRNRLPIFVPCYRVVAAGGKLGGFTGGIGLKIRLLAHEHAVLGRKAA